MCKTIAPCRTLGILGCAAVKAWGAVWLRVSVTKPADCFYFGGGGEVDYKWILSPLCGTLHSGGVCLSACKICCVTGPTAVWVIRACLTPNDHHCTTVEQGGAHCNHVSCRCRYLHDVIGQVECCTNWAASSRGDWACGCWHMCRCNGCSNSSRASSRASSSSS